MLRTGNLFHVSHKVFSTAEKFDAQKKKLEKLEFTLGGEFRA